MQCNYKNFKIFITQARYSLPLRRAVIEKFYVNLLGETFLKKGSPPDPFPKTFSIKSTKGLFSPVVDFKLKVFGIEFEKDPFSKRSFSIDSRNTSS